MRFLYFLSLCYLLTSCTQQNKKTFFHREVLPIQHFIINPAKDTVLKTAGGALLRIEGGSFAGADAPFTLEVKEALAIQDIVRAGLTTRSNGQLLSSGGMIYVNAPNERIRITKPLKISLPAAAYNVDMQLYKGEEKDGEMNWTEPKPIRDSMPASIRTGKTIFLANCGTCHALDKQLTGPALRGVEKRGPWTERQNLFDWTHNPGRFIPLTRYTTCLTQTFNGQIMPSFPQLSAEVLRAVYDYIKWGDTNERGQVSTCEDSCRRYDSALLVVNKQKRQQLIQDNGSMSEVVYNDSAAGRLASGGFNLNLPDEDLVTMEDNRAEYYRFSITAFGWYNVDMLLKERDDVQESTLTVTLQGATRQHVDIYLVVPVIKLFAKAGRTNNPDEFAFYSKDGKLPLPHGVGAYILALSETAEGVLVDFKEFTISHAQAISMDVKPSTKEDVYRLLQSLQLKDVSITVAASKHAAEIRNIDQAVKALQSEAEKLRPKGCACYCTPPAMEVADSLPKVNPTNVVPRP